MFYHRENFKTRPAAFTNHTRQTSTENLYATSNNLHKLSHSRVIALRDERHFNDIIHKMSYSIALNLKRIPLENELISLRHLHNFHSNRHKKRPHLPQLSWQSTSASVSLQSGRNLQQKLCRLNWTNLCDRSRNQPHLPHCLHCFVIPLTTETTGGPDVVIYILMTALRYVWTI